MGGLGAWVGEREEWVQRERERLFINGMGGRERERDCLLIGTEIVSSIVMSNLGVGPWGTL